MSGQLRADALANFQTLPSVSIAIDAGTIAHRHFLDIMLLAPYTSMRPFLYDTVEQTTLNSDDYGDIVANAITKLYDEKIVVRSIVGDNLPAQVSALAHWSDKSRLTKKGPLLARVKYSPCLCHFVQLIVGDIIQLAKVKAAEARLHQMIKIANSSDVHKSINCRCAQPVLTRWLSRCEALEWLLRREEILRTLNLRRLPEARAREIRGAFSEEKFNSLAVFHQLVFPLNQAAQFFERNDVTLPYVYPALKELKRYWRNEKDTTENGAHRARLDPRFLVAPTASASRLGFD
jgi:hypothetical protein